MSSYYYVHSNYNRPSDNNSSLLTSASIPYPNNSNPNNFNSIATQNNNNNNPNPNNYPATSTATAALTKNKNINISKSSSSNIISTMSTYVDVAKYPSTATLPTSSTAAKTTTYQQQQQQQQATQQQINTLIGEYAALALSKPVVTNTGVTSSSNGTTAKKRT